ncbi:MAG: hypothetical protein R3F27_07060 [Gammaproteobacteria bacterium]
MTEKAVDLGEIRGDWDFHSRYAANAMEQTLKRVNKLWRSLKRAAPADGQVPVSGPVMDEFIEACSQTRALCDDFPLLEEARPLKRKKAASKKRKSSRKAR